jgi:hypothetical protein
VDGDGCIFLQTRTDNGQYAAGGPPALRQIAATGQAILDSRAAHLLVNNTTKWLFF